jgi:hypothetical protein
MNHGRIIATPGWVRPGEHRDLARTRRRRPRAHHAHDLVPDRQAQHQCLLPRIAKAHAEVIGSQFAPTTAVAAHSVMHDEALVEIDVTAVVDDDA